MKYIAKLIATTLCAGIVGILSVFAEQITESQARAIASRRFNTAAAQPRTRGTSDEQLRLAYQQNAPSGQANLYVFTPANGNGFVIVAGDDCLPEILGYSDNNRFVKDSIPPQLQAIFQRYGKYIQTYSGKLLSSTAPKTRGGSAIAPLLGDIMWDQNEPYNQLTPTINKKHSPTGCVATAVAQIMRYYNWPRVGKGNGEYFIEGKTKNGQSISIDGNRYNWISMLNNYPDLSNKSANQAVARLMYDVGAAVKMTYGERESSAYSSNAAKAFLENFQYSSALRLMYRQSHSSKEWEATIQEELQAKRPVYYGGGSPYGGHAFVCDGYDGNGLYHINWGWSGHSNGYYALIELLPGYQGTGAGGGGGYISGQDMIVGIEPNYSHNAKPQPLLYAEDFHLAEGKNMASRNIEATLSAFNYSGVPITGKLGVLLYDDAGKIVKEFTANNGAKDMKIFYGPNDKTITLTGLNTLDAGTYSAYPAFYMTDKNSWVLVNVPLNMPKIYTLTIDNSGTVTVDQDNSHTVNLDATINTSKFYSGQNSIAITFTNNGKHPYNGLIGVRLVRNGNLTTFDHGDKGVYYTNSFIEPGASVTFKTLIKSTSAYENSKVNAGHLQVLYDKTNNMYDPNDKLSFIPHDILKSIPMPIDNATLELPMAKIRNSIPSDLEQGEELTVEVDIKLDGLNNYYSGPIALQYLQEDSNGKWIRGQLGQKVYVTLTGGSNTTLTFTGKVSVAEGKYTLAVGCQKYKSEKDRIYWYTALSYTPGKSSDVERTINVNKRAATPPPTTLPIVIDFNQMNTTAVESAKNIPLIVYPNPAPTELHVETRDGQPIRSAALYSLTGHCVKRIEVESVSRQLSIDVSQLPEGLYILRINGTLKGLHGAAKVFVGGKRH